MKGECYACGHQGEFEWGWLITDSNDDSVGVVTLEMTGEEEKIGDTKKEIYYCEKCHSEQ